MTVNWLRRARACAKRRLRRSPPDRGSAVSRGTSIVTRCDTTMPHTNVPRGRLTAMRVVYTHNYSARRIREQVHAGRYPNQHMYGMHTVEQAGAELLTTDHDDSALLSRVSRGLRLRFGDVRDELSTLSSRPDAVFAGEPLHVAGLARRRRLRQGPPLVGVFHQPAPTTSWWRSVVAGFDGVVCLSQRVCDQLVAEHGRDPATTKAFPWGPDRSHRLYPVTEPGERIVAAGKTGRDFRVLVEALRRTRLPATLWTADPAAQPEPGIIEVHRPGAVPSDPGARIQFGWQESCAVLAEAAVVAIPLDTDQRLIGLSELADALALGRPVVMTRSPFVDVDLDRIGCGITVGVGDVDGWAAALDRLMHDDELRRSMGRAARQYVEDGWHSDTFGSGVHELLRSITSNG